MIDMTQSTPSMSRSRIDLHAIIRAHKDASAVDVMSYMIQFERVVSGALVTVVQAIKEKNDLVSLKDVLTEVVGQSIVMGAQDLERATQEALDGILSNNRQKALARTLAWASLAEETRSANMMLFQSCLLFGRAPNGEELPDHS